MKAKDIYQNHAFVPIRIRLLPLIIMLSWLLFTVFLFVYGPYEYDISNKAQLYTYLTVVHIMLCLGYFAGMITSIWNRPIIMDINFFVFNRSPELFHLTPYEICQRTENYVTGTGTPFELDTYFGVRAS